MLKIKHYKTQDTDLLTVKYIKSGERLLGSHSILSNHLPGLLLEPVLVSQEQQAHRHGIFLSGWACGVLLQVGNW